MVWYVSGKPGASFLVAEVHPENGYSKVLENGLTLLPDYTASNSIRRYSSNINSACVAAFSLTRKP